MRNQTIKKAGRKNQRRTRRIRGGTVEEKPLFIIDLQEILKVKIDQNDEHLKYITTLKERHKKIFEDYVKVLEDLRDKLNTQITNITVFKSEYKPFIHKYKANFNEYSLRIKSASIGDKISLSLKMLTQIETVENTLLKIKDNLVKLEIFDKLKSMITSLYKSTILNIVAKDADNNYDLTDGTLLSYTEEESKLTKIINPPQSLAGGGRLGNFFTGISRNLEEKSALSLQKRLTASDTTVSGYISSINTHNQNIDKYDDTINKSIKKIATYLFYILHIIKYIDLLIKKSIKLSIVPENGAAPEIDAVPEIVASISIIENINNIYIFYIYNKVFKYYNEVFTYVKNKLIHKTNQLKYRDQSLSKPHSIKKSNPQQQSDELAVLAPAAAAPPKTALQETQVEALGNNALLPTGLTPTTATVLRPAPGSSSE